MILSFFHASKSHRPFLCTILLISTVTFWIRSHQGHIPEEIVPGAPTPDTAVFGYTPQQAWRWYESLDERGSLVVLQLGLLDLLGIIPSYTILFGAQLVATHCPDILCYVPLWTAMFDLMETVTHFLAILSHYHHRRIDDGVWQPSGFHLVIASASTQFKVVGLAISMLLIVYYQVKSQRLVGARHKDA